LAELFDVYFLFGTQYAMVGVMHHPRQISLDKADERRHLWSARNVQD